MVYKAINDVKHDKLLSVAIDFGTMYSGTAFSLRSVYNKDPTTVYLMKVEDDSQLFKVPTCILVDKDKTCKAFGKSAVDGYFDLTEEQRKDWYLFKEFKMDLYDDKKVSAGMLLKDECGKELPAITVFSLGIRFLKDGVLKRYKSAMAKGEIREEDANWVLTVPAIWSDKSKALMREAAEKAGIPSSCLLIALEPEVASIYCQYVSLQKDETGRSGLTPFTETTKYIVMDAGGGTIDFTAHEAAVKITDGREVKLKELHKSCGNGMGGKSVNDAFLKFLEDIFGAEVVKSFRENNPENFNDTMIDFEMKKRSVTKKEKTLKVITTIPDHYKKVNGKEFEREGIIYKKGKLHIEYKCVKGLFQSSIDSVIEAMGNMLDTDALKDCRIVLTVGGFSNCSLLQEELKTRFPNTVFVLPLDAELAVLKGAVIYGHDQSAIVVRICRHTYGIEVVSQFLFLELPSVFDTLVKTGQRLVAGEAQKTMTYSPARDDQTKADLNIYVSEKEDPLFVFDEECKKIGTGVLKMEDVTGGSKREINVSMYFGGTEFRVEAVDVTTGYKIEIPIKYFETTDEYEELKDDSENESTE